jgi:hypothetical protein
MQTSYNKQLNEYDMLVLWIGDIIYHGPSGYGLAGLSTPGLETGPSSIGSE